jgi:ankyrin repeat protein
MTYDIPSLHGAPLLHIVCMYHNVGAVEAMLECGAKVNRRDRDGNNEMMRVIIEGQCFSSGDDCGDFKKNGLEVVKLLLEAGSSIDMQNYAGESAWSLVSNFKYGGFRKPVHEYMDRVKMDNEE